MKLLIGKKNIVIREDEPEINPDALKVVVQRLQAASQRILGESVPIDTSSLETLVSAVEKLAQQLSSHQAASKATPAKAPAKAASAASADQQAAAAV